MQLNSLCGEIEGTHLPKILKPSVGIQFSFLIKQNKQEKKTPNASDFVNNEAGWKQKKLAIASRG